MVGLTFAVIDTGHDALESVQVDQEIQGVTPAPIVAQSNDNAVLVRLVRLETIVEQTRHNRVSDIVLGVLLALGFMVVILLLAVLYGR